ncbi:MAG: hypothetical protein SXQ77_03770 [Halobacteria archaeon]|nr:hypothetical protein [Halobacteria archaeon]
MTDISIDELKQKAEEYLQTEGLTLEENRGLLSSLYELNPVIHKQSYFILGSYGRDEIENLNHVKDKLSKRDGVYAFLMIDVRGEWVNSIFKFRVLADYSDYIVGVCEHNKGGFLVEQGMFVVEDSYFGKTYILKRKYDGRNDDDTYSWMQMGVFELLDNECRLYEWHDKTELLNKTEKIP